MFKRLVCNLVGERTARNAEIPYMCKFESLVFLLATNSLLKHLEKQHKMGHRIVSMPRMWEVKKAFLASGFGLAQLW